MTSLFIFKLVLQWLFVGGSTLYLAYCRVQAHRSNARSWQQIVADLQSLEAANFDSARLGDGRDELKAMFRKAGVVLEMASYAERNGGAESELIEALRRDAGEIRILTLKRLLFSVSAK